MRVGVFISGSNRMLHDLVVSRLSTEPDLEVRTLPPDPAADGRAPLGAWNCAVIVFAASAAGAQGIDDLQVRVGQSYLELLDDGRAAVAWTVSATARPVSIEVPAALPEAVRCAGKLVGAL